MSHSEPPHHQTQDSRENRLAPFLFSPTLLASLLEDDSPYGDATAWGLGIGAKKGRMTFRARYDQIACCTEEAIGMGRLRHLESLTPYITSGTPVSAGTTLLTLTGDAANIHTVWKPAQTLMEYAAGIATATSELVLAARRGNPEIAIACTRKQVPGAKAMSIKAILAGGAVPHRLGLSETLLIFAEHRAFLEETPSQTIQRLHRTWPERQVVVELATIDDAKCWLEAGADVIQLEKCSPEVVHAVVSIAKDYRAKIAAAGGVNAANAEEYAKAGADILVSTWPYMAKPSDVAVTIEALP